MLALSLVAAVAASSAPVADFDSFRAEVTRMVLSGERLPPDFLLKLSALPDDQRMLAVVYLRRAGLLTGDPVPLARIIPLTEPQP